MNKVWDKVVGAFFWFVDNFCSYIERKGIVLRVQKAWASLGLLKETYFSSFLSEFCSHGARMGKLMFWYIWDGYNLRL